MSAFNLLYAPATCKKCAMGYIDLIQFKYGDVWLHKYSIGDELIWDKNNVGSPETNRVVVYGISELPHCPNCKIASETEYDIMIVDNKILSAKPMESYTNYLSEAEGRFYVPLN